MKPLPRVVVALPREVEPVVVGSGGVTLGVQPGTAQVDLPVGVRRVQHRHGRGVNDPDLGDVRVLRAELLDVAERVGELGGAGIRHVAVDVERAVCGVGRQRCGQHPGQHQSRHGHCGLEPRGPPRSPCAIPCGVHESSHAPLLPSEATRPGVAPGYGDRRPGGPRLRSLGSRPSGRDRERWGRCAGSSSTDS